MLLFVALLHADTPWIAWNNEGDQAAHDLHLAAKQLEKTAAEIAASGRASQQAALESDAANVLRRAKLLQIAVERAP